MRCSHNPCLTHEVVQGPPMFTSGPFRGLPVLVRTIAFKSRAGLLTTGRRLIDGQSEEASKASYDASRQARAIAAAILEGFSKPSEARALKTLWALKTNSKASTMVSAVLQDLDSLIGLLIVSDELQEAKMQTAKAVRHVAAFHLTGASSWPWRPPLANLHVILKGSAGVCGFSGLLAYARPSQQCWVFPRLAPSLFVDWCAFGTPWQSLTFS